MFAELFAVADDIDARVLLDFDPGQGGVPLPFNQALALQTLGRPQHFWLGQPAWFRKTARNGCYDQLCDHGGLFKSGSENDARQPRGQAGEDCHDQQRRHLNGDEGDNAPVNL